MRLVRVDDIVVEPLGSWWVAFSPASGESSLLNDESAAILEVLQDGPADALSVCSALAQDTGVPTEGLVSAVQAHWQQLIDAGLVRPIDDVMPMAM